jgi:hypothetical protein
MWEKMRVFKGKVVILTLISIIMLFSTVTTSATAAASPVTVQVDGKNVKFPDAMPYFENNRVMIPIRFVSEALGAKVDYKKITSGAKVTRTVIIALGDKNISMDINSTKVLVDEKIVTLDAPARLQQNRTYVPLRFVSEALGASVKWNQSKHLVSISTGTNVTNPNPVPADKYGDFEWKAGYTDLAKKLFADNMKVTNGKLTFTLPTGAKGRYEAANGKITSFDTGKAYSYNLADTGGIGITLIYPGKTEQEAYMIYFPGTHIDKENNPKLAAAVANLSKEEVLVLSYTLNGENVAGTLTEVIKLAESL